MDWDYAAIVSTITIGITIIFCVGFKYDYEVKKLSLQHIETVNNDNHVLVK